MGIKLNLTDKQKELLAYIRQEIGRTGTPPTYDNMREELGLKSKSGIHRMVLALEQRGHIVRIPHATQTIQIVEGQGVSFDSALRTVIALGKWSPATLSELAQSVTK